MRQVIVLLLILFSWSMACAGSEADLQIRAVKPGTTVNIDRVYSDDKVLVNVVDAEKNQLQGLAANDFSITRSGRQAKIVSVQPVAENLDVPRNLVLVLDNSYSMQERNAVKALLAGVDSLIKIVRPVDRVSVVVFDTKPTTVIGDRKLFVRSLQSNQPDELREFAKQAYGVGLTPTTTLFEGILAGLDFIAKAPANEPRFLVVFSDGEDINSAFKGEVVNQVAPGVGSFKAYAIDFMPGRETDKFLATFASQHNGQIWKATSETNLVPIFQSVASRMQYQYVINYLFPPTGALTVTPASLTIDEVNVGTPQRKIDTATLALRPVLDSAYGVARWQATVSNRSGKVAELSGEGTPPVELQLQVPTADLQALAAGGDLTVWLKLQDKKGQELALESTPVKVNFLQTRANLAVEPAKVTIEEIKTIDASPLLGQVFFAKDSGELAAGYVRFTSPAETAGFDEQKFRDTLEKYYQLLNIIGKRLADNAAATVTLVGCNDNTGAEKGNRKLSTRRAEAVRNYLQTVWNIAPERMAVTARNLPQLPSTSRSKEGQAENRRVEIQASDPAILAPIRSVYLATRIDKPTLSLRPDIVAARGVADWKLTVANGGGVLSESAGTGEPAKEISVPLTAKGDLRTLATSGDITVRLELRDQAGQQMLLNPPPVKVEFIETSKRLAEKKDQRVQEKYALILFDFDKATIGSANQAIVERIVARIKALPEASVEVVGHTDNIGKEGYNIKLSERRAAAVYKQLAEAYGGTAGERLRYSGVGPNSPLYDNQTPEARSFNRTVTITLEYTAAE